MHSYAPLASNSGKQYGAIREGESLRPCCHRLRSATNKSACEPNLGYIVMASYSSYLVCLVIINPDPPQNANKKLRNHCRGIPSFYSFITF